MATFDTPDGVEGITRRRPTRFERLLGRIRGPCIAGWAVVVAIDWFVADLDGWLILGVTLAVFSLYSFLGTPRSRPWRIRPPVAGRWIAMNSPASRVPSHGLHAYGQTYAIDLTHLPEGEHRPESSVVWPIAHRPEEYPAFGQPVFAPVDGVVVKTHGTARDHLSRTSWIGLAYLFAESAVRELLGAGRILGNHVVIESDEGAFVVLAHLQRNSIHVREGDVVGRGQTIGRCGNSGNSTEPHVHLQMMDHRSPYMACGLPFVFEPETVDSDHAGLPVDGHAMVAAAPRT